MTRNTYEKYHFQRYEGKHESNRTTTTEVNYVPKHAAQWYNVWRVLGPAGPQESMQAYGLEEVRYLISGCHDYEVTTLDGKEVRI